LTLDTVVPVIHALCQLVTFDTGKMTIVNDLQAQYTIEETIDEFER